MLVQGWCIIMLTIVIAVALFLIMLWGASAPITDIPCPGGV